MDRLGFLCTISKLVVALFCSTESNAAARIFGHVVSAYQMPTAGAHQATSFLLGPAKDIQPRAPKASVRGMRTEVEGTCSNTNKAERQNILRLPFSYTLSSWL